MKRSLIVFSLLLCASLVFAGGQSDSSEPGGDEVIELTMSSWLAAEGQTRDSILEMLSRFEEENPGITVELVNIPFAQTEQQLIVSASGGNMPDVVHLTHQFALPVASMGSLENLDPYYDQETLSNLPAAARESGIINGELASIPWQLAPIVVLANRELLAQAGLPDEIPDTWDEFDSAVAEIGGLSDDIYGFGARTAQTTNSAFWFFPVLWGFGAEFVVDGEVRINSPEMIDALQWYRDLATEGLAPLGMNPPETRNLFAQDRVGFLFDGPWMKGVLRAATGLGEEADDTYLVGPVPAGDNGMRQGIANHHTLGVARQSDNKDAAVRLIRFLTEEPEIAEYYYRETGAIPVYQNILERPLFADDPYVQTFVDSADFTESVPVKDPNLPAALEVIAELLQTAMLTDQDLGEAVERAETQLEALF